MDFINPKTDFAFKRIFGSQESIDILISFLNALIYDNQDIIEDLEIIDPYTAGVVSGLKDSFVDVKAILNDKTIVIIEMQVLNLPDFKNRIIYNLAKTYTNQLKRGEGYWDLNPVIALTITDFKLFEENNDVINEFVLKERRKNFEYNNEKITAIFVELPKFNKELEELETLSDRWIYFMKNAPSLEIIPEKMSEIPAIEKAMTIANETNLTVKELDELKERELYIAVRKQEVIVAKQEGLEEGRQEGLEEGEKTGEIKLINRLLSKRFGEIPESMMNNLEKLSNEKLEELGELILDFNSVEDVFSWLEDIGNKN